MDAKKVAKGTVIVFVLTFVGLGLNYIYGIFLARWFGVKSFGIYSIGLSIFGILSVISVMGLDNAALKFTPKTSDIERKRLVVDIAELGLLFSCILGITLFLLRHFIAINIYNTPDLEEFLVYFSLAIPGYSLSSIFLAFLQASHNITMRMSIKYALEPIIKTSLTFGFAYFGVDILGAVAALAAGLWISVLLSLRTLLNSLDLRQFNKRDTIKHKYKEVLKYTLPVVIGIAFSITASKSDFILLGYMVSNTEVGLYAAAFQTAAITSIILQSVESVLAPYISEAINSNSNLKIKQVYTLSLRWVYMLGLPLFLFFILFPNELLGLFGEQFTHASLCFSLLAFGQFINIATGSANYVLLMRGKTTWVMVNSIVNGVMQIVLNIFLIPVFGIVGAAITMIIATSLINLIRLIEVYYLLRLHPYSWSLIWPTLIGCITYFLIFILKESFLIKLPILFSPLVFITYFLMLIFFGLSSDEKSMVYSMLNNFKK
jgi:O-antigen/teichoic acid export membrane protein